MEICCNHQNYVMSDAHPELKICRDCGVEFFMEDRLYWKQPWHLPKNMWIDTLKCLLIVSGTIAAAFIVKEAILNL